MEKNDIVFGVNILPEIGLVSSKSYMFFRTGKRSAYGFYTFTHRGFDNCDNFSFISNPKFWSPATDEIIEKFTDSVKQLLKIKGYIVGTRFKSFFNGFHKNDEITETDKIEFDENGISIGGDYVFYQGLWAEKI